jgi:hypothetical protein
MYAQKRVGIMISNGGCPQNTQKDVFPCSFNFVNGDTEKEHRKQDYTQMETKVHNFELYKKSPSEIVLY